MIHLFVHSQINIDSVNMCTHVNSKIKYDFVSVSLYVSVCAYCVFVFVWSVCVSVYVCV